MRRKAIVSFVFVMSFLVSVFAGAFSEAADSFDISGFLGPPIPRPGESVDSWPMFHHDLNHTGYSTSTATSGVLTWLYPTRSFVTSSPAAFGGMVYVGSGDNNVYALNATTGMQVWNYATNGPVNWGSAAVDSGVVYVGSNDGKVYALGATDGTLMWSYQTGGAIYSSPAVVNGVVYIGSTDGNVFALNAQMSTPTRLVWSYQTNGAVWSSPSVVDGVVYVGSDDGNVYALSTATMTAYRKLWNFPTGAQVRSSPAVVDGAVYVGSDSGNVYALDAARGSLVWSYSTGGAVWSSPAVVGGVVYVGSDSGNVYALKTARYETTRQLWSAPIGSPVQSSPAVVGGVVYVGSDDGNVYGLKATTGMRIWKYLTYFPIFSSPAVADGVLYVGSGDGMIRAFDKQIYVYRNFPHRTEPAPMGITDYGIGPNGPYEYSTTSFVGTITVADLQTLTNGPGTCSQASFQLNVELEINTVNGPLVFWVQNVADVTTSSGTLYLNDIKVNLWNFSEPNAKITRGYFPDISGGGDPYYHWQAPPEAPYGYCCIREGASWWNQQSMQKWRTRTTPTTSFTLEVNASVSAAGEPMASFGFDIGYGLHIYDTVTFKNIVGFTSLTGFKVCGSSYDPHDAFYDAELILGGPGGQFLSTTDFSSDVRLTLEYWNGHNYQVVPNAYNFGVNTAEKIDNAASNLSYHQENGTIFAKITPSGLGQAAGQLRELYNQSQTGVVDITSPSLSSGTLYITNPFILNPPAWQVPFTNGQITVTLHPGTYNLQLCNQAGQFFDQGNFTVTAGETLYLQAYAVPRSMEIIEAQDEAARVQTVDPAAAYDTASSTLLMNCYDTLVFFDGEHMDKYLPQLATEWSITQNNPPIHDAQTGLDFYQTYCFKIRTGVSFQDLRFGTVTPADVEYCFERGMILDPANGPQWMFYEPLLNGESHTYVNGQTWDPAGNLAQRNLLGLMIDHAIESNATHVWFNLAFPGAYAPFMQILSQTWSSIYSKAWANSLGRPTNWPGDWSDHTSWFGYCSPAVMPFDDPTPAVMGTGPFILAHLDYNQKYWDANRFTGYWRGWGNGPAPKYGIDWPAFGGSRPAGYINHYVVTWAYDWNTRSTKFLSGQVDICSVPRQYVGQMVNQPNIRCTYPLPTASVDVAFYQYDINPTSPYGPIYGYGVLGEAGVPRDFFGNAAYGVYVRKAFSHCINFTNLIANVLLGEAIQPATALIPTLPYYNASIPSYDFDLVEAAEFFHKWPGLWETGFTLNLPYNTGTGTRAAIRKTLFEMLAANINSLNTKFHVQAVAVPWASYSVADTSKQLPIFTMAWLADFPDPHDFALPYYTTWKGWQGYSFAERQGFTDATLDSLISQGINTPDGPARAQIYTQIQERIVDLCPSIALYSPISRYFEQTSVCGWYYNPNYPGTYAANLWKWYYTPHAQQGSMPVPPTSNYRSCDVDYGGKVTIVDIAIVASAFGSSYGPPAHSRWNFRADIDNNRIINVVDIAIAAKYFGMTSLSWTPS